MKIEFEISTERLENGRFEKEVLCEAEFTFDRTAMRNQDIENIKTVINEWLDKLKK